jgi:drug/metabolite transporter (DMT)-like permease
VVASLFTALNFILIRRMPKTPLAVIINTFSIVAICLGVITLILAQNYPKEAGFMAENVYMPHQHDVILWLVANGICGVLGQFCLTIALKVEEAGLVSLARTADIVMAFLFQVIWLPDERVHWTSILGAVIICSAVCLSALKKWLSQRPGKLNIVWILINCGHKDRLVV